MPGSVRHRPHKRYPFDSPHQWLQSVAKDADPDRMSELLNHLDRCVESKVIEDVFRKYMAEDDYYSVKCDNCDTLIDESTYDQNHGLCNQCVPTCSSCGEVLSNRGDTELKCGDCVRNEDQIRQQTLEHFLSGDDEERGQEGPEGWVDN